MLIIINEIDCKEKAYITKKESKNGNLIKTIQKENRNYTIKCENGYEIVSHPDNEEIICLEKSLVNIGVYKSKENIYYSCLKNCDICSNGHSCEVCSNGYIYINNKCIKQIENCKEYDENGICNKCDNNFGFKKEDRNECINIESLNKYYTKDNISYYPCNEKIKDCQNCYYDENNKSINCYFCNKNFILVNCDNKCYSKDDINKNKKYFYVNETHAKKCSNEIENCDECESSERCLKCSNNYFMINNNEKKCWKKNEIESIDEYYLNDKNTTYYSCNDTKYNYINNCKKCLSKDSCYSCKDEYTFVNGDKSVCSKKEELKGKYILDPNDNTNYIKCSNFINNCDLCNNEKCILCNKNYIFINGNFLECILKDSIDINYYFTNDNITYYSRRNNK